MSKEKDFVTFNEEDEDTLVEEGPQIERVTLFPQGHMQL